jgi:hypothetical protein
LSLSARVSPEEDMVMGQNNGPVQWSGASYF